jgi:hypothetical protein
MNDGLDPVRGRASRAPARATTLALTVLASLLAATIARADDAPVSGSVGYDYYRGSQDQTTWRPIGEVTANLRKVAATLSISRFDDNQVGNPWGYTGGLLFPIVARTKLDLSGTGFSGDSTDGAYRLKLGPQFEIAKDRTLGLYAEHFDNRRGETADALSGEFDTPLVEHFSGSAGLSVSRSEGTTGEDASLGIGWAPTDLLELVVDGDVSRNSTGLTGLLPSRHVSRTGQNGSPGGKGRPAGGTTTTTSTAADVSESVTVGMRLHF